MRGAKLVLAIAAVTAIGASAQDQSDGYAMSFDNWQEVVAEGTVLTIDNPWGDVYLRYGGEEDLVDIVATVQSFSGEPVLTIDSEYDVETSTAIARVVAKERGLVRRGRADLAVFVPTSLARVEVGITNGTIRSRSVPAVLALHAKAASIRLVDVKDDLEIKIGDGRIEAALEDARNLRIDAGRGEVVVWIPDLQGFDAELTSGGRIASDFNSIVQLIPNRQLSEDGTSRCEKRAVVSHLSGDRQISINAARSIALLSRPVGEQVYRPRSGLGGVSAEARSPQEEE